MKTTNLSYAEAISAMQAGYKVRHKNWKNNYILNPESIVSVPDTLSIDWEIIVESLDTELEELKKWVCNDLDIKRDRTMCYYPIEKISKYEDLWNIFEHYLRHANGMYDTEKIYKNILFFIKRNNILEKNEND